MGKARQNRTVVVEENLLLEALVDETNRRRLARARLRQSFEAGLVNLGDLAWSRDDLYDR